MNLRANIVSNSDTPLGMLVRGTKDEVLRASAGCHAEKSFNVFNVLFISMHMYYCQDALWWVSL